MSLNEGQNREKKGKGRGWGDGNGGNISIFIISNGKRSLLFRETKNLTNSNLPHDIIPYHMKSKW